MKYIWSPHSESVLHDGKVLAFAGINGDSYIEALATAELYDPETGNWTHTDRLNCPRFNFPAITFVNGKVMAIGGSVDDDGGLTSSTELYDPSTNKWTSGDSINLEREMHTASLLENGKVLVVGGYSDFCEKTTELYHSE